jgi:uncharacterized membrane protein
VYRFVVTLHVLSAVLLIGPLLFATFGGYQAVRRHDAEGTRSAASMMARFSLGSLLVALLGVGAIFASDRFSFRTPWVIISSTLYVIMMGLATGSTVPALRRAARVLDEGVLARPALEEEPSSVSATTTEVVNKERLDNLAGRIAGSGGLVTLAAVAITVFMTVRPFGD